MGLGRRLLRICLSVWSAVGHDGGMSLTAQIRVDLTASMKARDTLTTDTLRLALGAIMEASVAGKVAVELSDEEILKVLANEAKKRTEAAEANTIAGRPEQVERELAERRVLEAYLPAKLDDAELSALIDRVLGAAGLSTAKDLGQAMKLVQAEVAGRAEGRVVASLVKTRLA